jgi:hypothetical protein
VTSAKASASAAALRSLADQRQVIEGMLVNQRTLTDKARADMESGVISRTEYAKEAQTLDQLQLALLSNTRAVLDGRAALEEAQLAQSAVRRPNEAPLMPELMAHEEQAIRVELELVHLESDMRSKRAERGATTDRIGQLDALERELKTRPIYQAAEKSLDVAFVPYTQIDGVEAGSAVFSCTWSLFFCQQVGTVAELVPGEVVLADPWGVAARGQYAILNLTSPEAARAKTLRVRAVPRSSG